MLKFDKLPIVSPDRPVVGQIWKEERANFQCLWEVIEVTPHSEFKDTKVRFKVLHQIGEGGHNRPVGFHTHLLNWAQLESMVCVSLPRKDVKVGQTWYQCEDGGFSRRGSYVVEAIDQNGLVTLSSGLRLHIWQSMSQRRMEFLANT